MPLSIHGLLQLIVNDIAKTRKQPPALFYEKGVLKNFAKFTKKLLRRSTFFNKVADHTFFTEYVQGTASEDYTMLLQ